jgi:hypothetical protein
MWDYFFFINSILYIIYINNADIQLLAFIKYLHRITNHDSKKKLEILDK